MMNARFFLCQLNGLHQMLLGSVNSLCPVRENINDSPPCMQRSKLYELMLDGCTGTVIHMIPLTQGATSNLPSPALRNRSSGYHPRDNLQHLPSLLSTFYPATTIPPSTMSGLLQVLNMINPRPAGPPPADYEGLEYKWKMFTLRPAYYKMEAIAFVVVAAYLGLYLLGRYINTARAKST